MDPGNVPPDLRKKKFIRRQSLTCESYMGGKAVTFLIIFLSLHFTVRNSFHQLLGSNSRPQEGHQGRVVPVMQPISTLRPAGAFENPTSLPWTSQKGRWGNPARKARSAALWVQGSVDTDTALSHLCRDIPGDACPRAPPSMPWAPSLPSQPRGTSSSICGLGRPKPLGFISTSSPGSRAETA